MDVRHRYRVLTLLCLAAPAMLQAQAGPGGQHGRGMGMGMGGPDTLPADVTAATIAEGRAIFTGKGLCFSCHNVDATGGVGPNLTDGTWLHGMGTYRQILHHVERGFGPEVSRTGIVMPPRGGSGISDAQLQAVAAYVWTLSHPDESP